MYTEILMKSPFFKGVPKEEISLILSRLSARHRKYGTGETILWEGDRVQEVGILLTGSARSMKTDLDGRQVLITLLSPGSYIGVLLAASKARTSPVSVQAQAPSQVLFMPIGEILRRSDCPCHATLLENLLNGIAEKALVLHDRNNCLIQPSIREKVLTFLTMESKIEGACTFQLAMGRDAMAEYLNVDRSALSRELSRMKRDGLIDYHKSWFKLRYNV